MWIKPLAGVRVSIGANLDVRAIRFVVKEVPPLPAISVIRWILGRPVLFLIDQIPFPGTLLFRESFPRLVP
jgi:hypothetical protein